jgi:hypothetical protein
MKIDVIVRGVLARLEDRCNNTVVEKQVLILRLNTKLSTMTIRVHCPVSIYLYDSRVGSYR